MTDRSAPDMNQVNLFDFPNASAPAPGQPSSMAPIRGAAE